MNDNEQIKLESENRFDLFAKGHETKSTETLTSKNNFISGLKFSSININKNRLGFWSGNLFLMRLFLIFAYLYLFRGKNLSRWPSLIFINLRLWQFKRQKMTAPYQRLNYFRNLFHTACTEKIES